MTLRGAAGAAIGLVSGAKIGQDRPMPASTEPPLLPPHLTSDHTAWAIGDMQHVGAYHAMGDTWEVLHIGPGFQHPHGVYTGEHAREHAAEVAEAMAYAMVTVSQIPPSAVRSMLEFFQPRASA